MHLVSKATKLLEIMFFQSPDAQSLRMPHQKTKKVGAFLCQVLNGWFSPSIVRRSIEECTVQISDMQTSRASSDYCGQMNTS